MGLLMDLLTGLLTIYTYTIIILDFCWDCKTYYHWDYHAKYYNYGSKWEKHIKP